ncbi:MAG TPA: Dabb family protein [Phycisphaerae bacterium]|nr:Dabb family protein [Phycisphaerae bacterium]
MSTYVHAVFFTFRDAVPPAEIDRMVRDAAELSAIPSVRKLHCGRRDDTIRRPVSDTAFHVGLLVCFDDRQGYDTYSAHPVHTDFVARYKPLWADLKVCDFIAP